MGTCPCLSGAVPTVGVCVWACRELIGKQDPYLLLEFKEQRQRTNTIKNGGTNPYFNEEELEVYVQRLRERLVESLHLLTLVSWAAVQLGGCGELAVSAAAISV